jgi:alkylated DNA repair dioxygenase AlkB
MNRTGQSSLPLLQLEGLVFEEEFLTPDQERNLIGEIQRLEFHNFEMRGMVSRRRVAHFGWNYDYEAWRIKPGQPIPGFILPLRERAARMFDEDPENLAEVLVTEYAPGAGIGWHRDAPMFGKVAGVSLRTPCTMKFRRKDGDGWQTAQLVLPPRSAYAFTGDVRRHWQHSIPGVKDLRYSITFRTLVSRPPKD